MREKHLVFLLLFTICQAFFFLEIRITGVSILLFLKKAPKRRKRLCAYRQKERENNERERERRMPSIPLSPFWRVFCEALFVLGGEFRVEEDWGVIHSVLAALSFFSFLHTYKRESVYGEKQQNVL